MAEPAVKEFAYLEPQITIQWKAFELRPYQVPTLDPNGEYLTSAWREHVYPLAQKMGFTMTLPPIQPRTRLAHAAAKWAEKNSMFNEYNGALFKAFFQNGQDIGKVEVLLQLAGELGLDARDLESALEMDSYIANVLEDEEKARQAAVKAVPAFVINGKVLAAGMQSASRLQELMNLKN